MDDFDNIDFDITKETQPFKHRNKVDIYLQKRNTKKSIVSIQGLDLEEEKMKDLLKEMKKKFSCNGTYEKEIKVLTLQGDSRYKIKELLIKNYGYREEDIIIHGTE